MTGFSPPRLRGSARQLLVVFGDQLDATAAAFGALDAESDGVLLMEVAGESELGPSHRQRTALFLSAMRHFAAELAEDGFRVEYVTLDDPDNTGQFGSEIVRIGRKVTAQKLLATHPGDWRVLDALHDASASLDVPCDILPDEHFLTDLDAFEDWASGKKRLVMEYFYRDQRRRLDVLMDGDEPEGGKWNWDEDNRQSFKQAPDLRRPYTPRPDAITRQVCALVNERLPDQPGQLDADDFRWPVTRTTARRALDDFIEHRLPLFGTFEDAMWRQEPFVYHSLLSAALNLKLIDPRECVRKAVEAYDRGAAPLNAVEGFVRQIIGWREFIRGIYWTQPRDYRDRNALEQFGDLPDFYWTAETDMHCMRDALQAVLEYGYSHHIPRLMVLSNFALIAGVLPRAIGDWFSGMYVDAVDWVTTPNTIGMGMHADGAVVGTKPYAASGRYIQRMGNFCASCRFDVNARTGEDACPFNVFYWDFLQRNRSRLSSNTRMAMMLKNLNRIETQEQRAITADARLLRQAFGIGGSHAPEPQPGSGPAPGWPPQEA